MTRQKCCVCNKECDYIKCETCKKTYCDSSDCVLSNVCDDCGDVAIYEHDSDSHENINKTQNQSTQVEFNDDIKTPASNLNFIKKIFKALVYTVIFMTCLLVIYDVHVITYEYIALMDAHMYLKKQVEEYKHHLGWCSLPSFFMPNK